LSNAHVIEFNDKESDGWGITIKDYNGNIINLDTKGKNITITAPATMTLNATDLNVNVSNSINVQSTGANNGIGKINVTAKENIRTNSKEGDISTTAEQGDMTLAADKGLFGVSSKTTEMKSKGNTTESSGGVFKIIGASNVEINK
jgi:hypothetical protein